MATKPKCNHSTNGVEAYSLNPIQDALDAGTAWSSLVVATILCTIFTSILVISLGSNGINLVTILLSLSVTVSLASMIYNYVLWKKVPEGYTTDCIPMDKIKPL